MYIIGRPINGISLNGNEYICNSEGRICNSEGRTLLFSTVEDAKAVLYNAGYTDDSIEAEGIIIEEELK